MKDTKKPRLLVDPAPRSVETLFTTADLEELNSLVELVPAEGLEESLPSLTYIMGQTDLDRSRLGRARNLKAIFNVEGNFLPNIDYEYCFERGIHVLNISPVFAQAVAELGLGMALDLARGISRSHAQFRAGGEAYGLESNQGMFTIAGRTMGIIGLGDLGTALLHLLKPFRSRILIHDPWIPPSIIAEAGGEPVDLDYLLAHSNLIFVTASVTSENEGFLGATHFNRMPEDAIFVLLSRAAVVDFEELTRAALRGRIRVATDVFPQEPLPADHPIRNAEMALLSAHRAGALEEVFFLMGRYVLDDLRLMNKGLPPRRCKRAERETVGRLRSRPVAKS